MTRKRRSDHPNEERSYGQRHDGGRGRNRGENWAGRFDPYEPYARQPDPPREHWDVAEGSHGNPARRREPMSYYQEGRSDWTGRQVDGRQEGRTSWRAPSRRSPSFGDWADSPDHRGRGPTAYRRSDERIAEDVNECLTEDHYLDASGIEVKVEQGEVTLDGTVSSRVCRRHAEALTDEIWGVRHVQNNLRIGVLGGPLPRPKI